MVILKDGDMWFNNCTGETWIRYDETWITLVNGGPKGPQGPKGDKGEDSTVQGPEGPQGEQGETGTFKTICSLSAPDRREDGSELRCGDMWFNTCSGELYVYYSGNWLGISDATGPQGPQGEQGPQGPGGLKGDPPKMKKNHLLLPIHLNQGSMMLRLILTKMKKVIFNLYLSLNNTGMILVNRVLLVTRRSDWRQPS